MRDSLLAAGHCVIFDFGGNTVRDRQWVRSVFESVGARHELHYIIADESLCKQRVAERNRSKPAGKPARRASSIASGGVAMGTKRPKKSGR